MLVSELQEVLQKLKLKFGDVPVFFKDDKLGWIYHYDTYSFESTGTYDELMILLRYKETHDF